MFQTLLQPSLAPPLTFTHVPAYSGVTMPPPAWPPATTHRHADLFHSQRGVHTVGSTRTERQLCPHADQLTFHSRLLNLKPCRDRRVNLQDDPFCLCQSRLSARVPFTPSKRVADFLTASLDILES